MHITDTQHFSNPIYHNTIHKTSPSDFSAFQSITAKKLTPLFSIEKIQKDMKNMSNMQNQSSGCGLVAAHCLSMKTFSNIV